MKTIEHIEECKSCGGTGLYIGLAERDGMAVVCHGCKGTGAHKYRHEYEEFTGRRERGDVVRVLQINLGIIVGSRHGDYSRFGGMSYFDWNEGKPFPSGSEMRESVCPAWWYQTADYKKKPLWDECGSTGTTFSRCRRFLAKETCWARWDKEFGGAERIER